MARKRPRVWRILRIRSRRVLARIGRQMPRWMRWLAPWGTSLSLHAAALIVLGLTVYITSVQGDRGPRIEAEFPAGIDLTSLADGARAGDPFTRLDSAEAPSLTIDPQRVDPHVSNVPELPPNFRLGPDVQLTPPPGRGGPGAAASGGQGALVLSSEALTAPFSGRQGPARARMLRREGGSAASEEAVGRGLDWLVRHQRADGSWGLDHRPQCRKGQPCPADRAMQADTAATGLALLPLLGAGHIHTRFSPYQQDVAQGLSWLLKQQKPDGDLFTGGGGTTHMYSHAIATMALSEAYGLSGDPKLREAAQRAVVFIVAAQNRGDGGWRYEPGEAGDTCVFGWQMFALRSAHLSGLRVAPEAVKRASGYLDRAAADKTKATYAYQPGGKVSPVMTAEALLCRQYLGWPRDTPGLILGASQVAGDLVRSKERNLYYWYYATQLIHNLEGPAWSQWNPLVRTALVESQAVGEGCDRGSWDPNHPAPDAWGKTAGRHFQTALSLLTLEVYYRYLPIYRERDYNPVSPEMPAAPDPKKAARP